MTLKWNYDPRKYVGKPCPKCGHSFYHGHNDECATCSPREQGQITSAEQAKRNVMIRRRIEEHQHRRDNEQ